MTTAARLLDVLRGQRQELLGFLERLALAESPSTNRPAQRPAFDQLAEALERLQFAPRLLPGRASGGQLYARPQERNRARPIQLLLGHIDTVWPQGTLADMPVRLEGDRLRGPGVYDMKGGLTQIVFALRALRELDLEMPVTPVVFVNSDEEIGSRESTRHIRRLARMADRAYVLEPSLGLEGRLKTARKGIGRFTLTVKGKAAHAGLNPEAGASAILELSHQIQRLFALNDPAAGVSVNVGMIDGGINPNVVAPESRAVIDVRVPTHEAARRVEQAIRALTPVTPGVSLKVEGAIGRPPMEHTPAGDSLWQAARTRGLELGLQLEQASAGGGSDGNTTSQYTATLDGLGPVGDGAHAHHEYVVVDKLIERAALLALLLLEPPLRGSLAS
ncbi:MAG: M20 family peptidase [Candidatus Competibacteraceae bacterium]|nr:MAG: M20 family peptidase [Candidatus Competibacteraceae bacterium]